MQRCKHSNVTRSVTLAKQAASVKSQRESLSLLQRAQAVFVSQQDAFGVQNDVSRQSWLWRSEEKKPKNEGDEKIPTGFEKLLKRTRRGITHDKAEKPDAKKDGKESKETEKDAKKAQDSEEELSEQEDHHDNKREKKEKENEWSRENISKNLKNLFFLPGGGGPMWERWMLLAAANGFIAWYLFGQKKPSEEITYMDFVHTYLAQNQVEMITLCEDKGNSNFKYRANIDTLEGKTVHLVLPQVENFLYKLDLAQREMGKDPSAFVPVKYGASTDQEATPLINLFIGGSFAMLLIMVYRSMHGKGGSSGTKKGTGSKGSGFGGGGGMGDMMTMSKSGAQVFGVDKKIRTRFKHVAGMQNAKQEVLEFVDFLKNPEKYKKLGAKVPRGALLVGPPGTGKTLLAKAVAGEAGVPFFSISGSDFVQMYVGVGASRVRDLFKQAKAQAPSIIFIDEIDAVAKKRDQKFSSNDERDNTLNQMLVEMDGFDTDQSVIVLGATNLADTLDPAIQRPGRFDRQIDITLPSIDERREIYNVHLKKIKVNKEKTRDEYAVKMSALTPGFSGADIANVCNEGAIIAARTDMKDVSMKQFEDATERVIGGIEKKTVMTHEERKTVAYHEAGHAVAGWFLEHSNPLLKVTIIPRSKGSLGFAQYLPEELNLYTKESLYDMMCVALGGRIAEKIFFGKVTTGAGDDIRKVTQIAQSIVSIYGMSDKIGLVSFQSEQQGSKPYSDETNYEIDMEVKRIVDECFERTQKILEDKRELIEALGEELLAKESINLPQIINVLGERPFPLKESVKEYLKELETRAQKEEAKAAEDAKTKEQEEVDAAEQALHAKVDDAEDVEKSESTSAETTEEKKESVEDEQNKKDKNE